MLQINPMLKIGFLVGSSVQEQATHTTILVCSVLCVWFIFALLFFLLLANCFCSPFTGSSIGNVAMLGDVPYTGQ